VAAVDVEAEASSAGVQRSGLAYANALVASPAAFGPKHFTLPPGHPADVTTRVYIGDLHGRLWKFLSADPTRALLMADLGADQPIGTSAALLGLPASGLSTSSKPFVFLASGNDSRATGTFKMFSFRDDGDDTTATYGSASGTPDAGVKVYSPAFYLFSKTFVLPNFRGTIQPATFVNRQGNGRVFYGGTRFNPAGTPDAPPPYPCRSSFDSIIFALGAETGGAAYDLNASGSDEYMMFTNSRKTGMQIIQTPVPPGAPPGSTTAGTLQIDEGLGGSVTAPPIPGEKPKIAGPPSVGMADIDLQGRRFAQMTIPQICQ
jgi:hypothetical protein